MTEIEIRKEAHMHALVLEGEAIMAQIEGMKVFNIQAEAGMYAVVYPKESFDECEAQLLEIAKRLRSEL